MALTGLDSDSLDTEANQGIETTSPPTTTKASPQVVEVESVKCDSCGFTEDCTPPYIRRVRDRYKGKWLCGLCTEAVKDEVVRSNRLISMEEAFNRHTNFYNNFRSNAHLGIEHPISALVKIMRKGLDSTRPLRSNSTGLLPNIKPDKAVTGSSLSRSGSCFSAISR
ncbi:hypothetical protein LWI28_027081 [Acer negundo]|uniref:DUF1677 family protein n=1 Tax=Acer negundo TaxID=4023 RepID=A0AAD5JBL7_ACENE|nr:hypothetical protein LWI28_027081 [Acer negundo]KAK4853541.1 hypothetical protein QYF36_010718 [Acer negundo]